MADEFNPTDFLKDLKKTMGKEETSIGMDENFNIKKWYSTGSWMLDMQLNGGYISKGGIPEGKLTVLAGPESCGKTYFAIQAMKYFLKENPVKGYVAYFDSEANVSSVTFLNAGIPEEDIARIIINRVATYEEFRTRSIQAYKKAEDAGISLMVVLDSLGALISQKEMDEANADPDKEGLSQVKATVGRPQMVIKQFTKMLCKHAPLVSAPIIFISHVYADIGSFFGGNTIAGGSGPKYMNSNLVVFSRAKNKEGNDTIHDISGILVSSRLAKSRFAREETKVKSLINFNQGVIPHFGFVSLLEQGGLIKKTGNRYFIEKDAAGEWTGKKYWGKELIAEPDKFIKPFLPDLEPWTIKNFGLGKVSMNIEAEDIDVNTEVEILDFDNTDEVDMYTNTQISTADEEKTD